MIKFRAKIEIIGVNPFVFLPEHALTEIFKQANTTKGKIPIKMKIDGHEFTQTLIKWQGAWRLYLNMPMRKAAQKDVGDTADFEIIYDPVKRGFPMHPKLKKALQENPSAKEVYESLRPSLQLEINRYLSFLKTEESVDRNVIRAIQFLLGKGRFIGRDKP
ncbi:MAG TPA: YdeI/OmpD-associated family protein [Anaerolineales bacterium]|nr:YdeI/OmpD-associated family protein [Anaerolineales bacterium]HNM37450.1 YdeI/OmpD-associated family protein [Anaerolineales bacterium]HNO92971.1 YdeI/OmpD-associated family protein [Anaerolineales bacterium]